MEDSNSIAAKKPEVSVCIPTYQHAEFISECIDSIINQKTTFSFEIVLGEDASTDGTREICIDYAKKYPHLIRLFLRSREEVIYIEGKPTGRNNLIQNIIESRGEYVAICEGDDYWTDPYKLQKQYDFLQNNSDFGICFHKVTELNMFNQAKSRIIPNTESDTIYNIGDYILSNKTATCSIFFRKSLFLPIPDWFYKVPFGDLGLILQVMNNSNGKGMVLNQNMGVYRIHPGGMHGKLHKNNQSLIKAFKLHIKFTHIISKSLFGNSQYKKDINLKLVETYQQIYTLNGNSNFIMKLVTGMKILYYKLLLNRTGK